MYNSSQLPILIIAFRRPKTLERVLKSLEGLSNPLYIWIDGPRNLDDSKNISECLEVISKSSIQNLVKIFQASGNIGIGFSIPTAINWVFNFESEILILEDDILIDTYFLEFATAALEKFNSVPNVMSVIGFNCVPLDRIARPSENYRFSVYTSSWAWATWRHKWNEVSPYMFADSQCSFVPPRSARGLGGLVRWGVLHRNMRKGIHLSWDHRWLLVNWSLKKLQVVSNSNHSLNIGFGTGSTHTMEIPAWMPENFDSPRKSQNLDRLISQDLLADQWMAANVYRTSTSNLIKHIMKKFLTIS